MVLRKYCAKNIAIESLSSLYHSIGSDGIYVRWVMEGSETMRVSLLLQLVPIVICLIAAGRIYLKNLASDADTSWRHNLAASIPAVYTFFLLLVLVLPIQIFLIYTLKANAWFPLVILTLFCLILGTYLPDGYFRLRRVEADGRIYAALGVRLFRNIVTYGDLMIKLMRIISPESYKRLKRYTLADRERRTRRSEKIHWALLLGMLPATVWAVMQRNFGFAVYLLVANLIMNVYPIILQRYTRARLEQLKAHIC